MFSFIFEICLQVAKHIQSRDPDNVIGLVSEVLPEHSCLIFCPTKKQCESLTNNIITLTNEKLLCPPWKVEKREELLNLLEIECTSICPILKKSIKMGVAYHHSGLTQEERKLVEEGFLDGTISVICCTGTLAAGVNLPARRYVLFAKMDKIISWIRIQSEAFVDGYFDFLPDTDERYRNEFINESTHCN